MKILIAGASGGIGRALSQFLHNSGHSVLTLTRNPENAKQVLPFAEKHLSWNEAWETFLPEIDAIVNLSGASIGKRWSKKHKQAIYSSRIDTTREIVTKLNSFDGKSIAFFSTSAIGIYPSSEEEVLDENSELGTGFLAKVCKDWEKEAFKLKANHRLVVGRFGIVLKKDDVALQRILLSYKFGFGVVIGTGYQWFSWIHINDLVNLISKSISDDSFQGVYNFVSPSPVRYRELIKSIGKILGKPFILSIPDYIIKVAFGEQSEVLLSSQKVIPKRLLEINHKFKYNQIEEALRSIIC